MKKFTQVYIYVYSNSQDHVQFETTHDKQLKEKKMLVLLWRNWIFFFEIQKIHLQLEGR